MSDQFLDVDEEQPIAEVGVESILNQLLDVMAAAKSMPLSSSAMVSREEVTSLVTCRSRRAARRAAPGPLAPARARGVHGRAQP